MRNLALALLCGGMLLAQRAGAQEMTGLQAAIVLQEALEESIAKCEKSMVAIARSVRKPNERFGTDLPELIPSHYGAGVIIDEKGLILTNYHVIDPQFDQGDQTLKRFNKATIFVWTHDQRPHEASVVAADPRSDLAVLRIRAGNLTAMEMAPVDEVEKIRKGKIVVALGNPYAIARDGSCSASYGIISNVSRKLRPDVTAEGELRRTSIHHFGTLLQTDASLEFGNSGGALINLKGQMVALTNALAALPGDDRPAGFAVPLDKTFRRAVEALQEGREVEYGFLGIRMQELGFFTEQLNGAQGVRVSSVSSWVTPARRAGLQPNDVIVEVNGEQIKDSDSLIRAVGSEPVNATVRMQVRRGPRRIKLRPTKLTKYPVDGTKIVTNAPEPARGLQVDYPSGLNRFARHSLPNEHIPLLRGCVAITSVAEGSPAEESGLRKYQLITHVGGQRVSSPEEFYRLARAQEGPLFLDIVGRSKPVKLEAQSEPSSRAATEE